MRNNDELCIKIEELCIKNEEFCIKNGELSRKATGIGGAIAPNSSVFGEHPPSQAPAMI